MAISAWKQIKGTQHKWALRVNPSSGNLHPTETHILLNNMDGIENGAYHYLVKTHHLEKRSGENLLLNVWTALGLSEIAAPSVMLVHTSIFWREAWKYRDRAFRYCQLDLGHAAGAVLLSAARLGWRSKVITEFSDSQIAQILGLEDSDEKPMTLIPIFVNKQIDQAGSTSDPRGSIANTKFLGKPNSLSSSEVNYKSIDNVYKAGCIDQNEFQDRVITLDNPPRQSSVLIDSDQKLDLAETYLEPSPDPCFEAVVRTRRSAVDMDGQLRISLARMSRILIDSTRGYDSSFAKVLPWARETSGQFFIHILLYVHRVDGIAPGVYCFDRNSLFLYQLSERNVQNVAKFVSCLQDIAADGVFAVSLVADFESAFSAFGERAYRYIHQEAGFIGQLFYLTAHALGIEATGIGCFLDDDINQSLPPGMETVYNFTFGRAVQDPRLTDLPSYDFPDPSESFWNTIRSR